MLLALSIISGIVCFLGGVFFGVIPLREEHQSAQQKMLGRTVTIVVLGLIIILIFTKQDLASWLIIVAALAGFGVGKIPLLRKFLSSHWAIFRDKDAKTLSPRKAKKRAQNRK